MQVPEMLAGERYAGVVVALSTQKPIHHVILAPYDELSDLCAMSLYEAVDYTNNVCRYVLPTRQEAALLFANVPQPSDTFWRWTSNESADGTCAWQYRAHDGTQKLVSKSALARIQLVRLVPV